MYMLTCESSHSYKIQCHTVLSAMYSSVLCEQPVKHWAWKVHFLLGVSLQTSDQQTLDYREDIAEIQLLTLEPSETIYIDRNPLLR